MNIFIEDQKKLLQSYITTPDVSLSQSDLKILTRTLDPNRLLHITKCPASSTLIPKRDFFTRDIIGFNEINITHADANAKNSMSLKRAPAADDSVRGKPMNYPFWPGGFDEPVVELKSFCTDEFDFNNEPRLKIPPGFLEGYDFVDEELEETNVDNVVNLLTALESDLELNEWWDTNKNDPLNDERIKNETLILESSQNDDSLLEALQPVPILQISLCSSGLQFSSQWAEVIDTTIPVTDFAEKIPDPVKKWHNFELDNFQKQAIIKLEEHKYVFIAAHTSAGKTVIAEYAIALSQKHRTRTIYTSPIKALSNQKYNDFKKEFEDVGLITGDLQISPTATCLIMTTEILRSMLYGGSEVTRDLEYVIFDEVHYINDPERGHVWEEVIMLLPEHVNIIMLSATVPNVIELAEWVGMIKKKKVYVISTLKRPIPLEHYLYIDSGGKNKTCMHLLVDSKNQFLFAKYNLVKTELEERRKVKSGPPNNLKEEQRKWGNLIDYLNKDNKLPVIAFTLSRNRCDSNALALRTKDLNSGKEKSGVHILLEKCLSKLKPEDRQLQQVLDMEESLKRGIGVHHSGILPILKEIVEMAFQSGWVKVLFATETFSMGVNMPAKSVVFDSFKKHDGNELRCLKPSEYTQMAGRAGRRGHDKTGTVILFCKHDIPSQFDLQNMILGRADLLLSKFRLRYAVILKCLCNQSMKVEDIMKQSFKEFNFKKERPSICKHLEEIEEKLMKLDDLDKTLQPLLKFFDISFEYLRNRQNLMTKLFEQPVYAKELKPGKVIVLSLGSHYNKLGIILNIKNGVKPKPTMLKILVLDNQKKEEEDKDSCELWHNMISLTKEMQFYRPNGVGGHNILEIQFQHIVGISKNTLKIEPELIIKNWEQRQIERFKDSQPSSTVQKAVTELYQLNENYITKPNSLQMIMLQGEHNINIDQINELSDLWKTFNEKKQNLHSILPYTNIVNFQTEYRNVFKRKMLEKTRDELKYKISAKSLSLYTDYRDKLCVLKELGYVDENELVLMKGKIAYEMGQNELFITELIYSNTFTDLEPAEIAALLSGLVFQAKTNVNVVSPNENIKKVKEHFEKIYHDIELTERKYNLHPGVEHRLNFGLIEVVYNWANNKPFCEIMKITDIQEGIIVRCIQQLDETIQDVRKAAKRFGHNSLQKKMEDASTAIKRDIVFTPSLYISI